jgi:hypothetical protein
VFESIRSTIGASPHNLALLSGTITPIVDLRQFKKLYIFLTFSFKIYKFSYNPYTRLEFFFNLNLHFKRLNGTKYHHETPHFRRQEYLKCYSLHDLNTFIHFPKLFVAVKN